LDAISSKRSFGTGLSRRSNGDLRGSAFAPPPIPWAKLGVLKTGETRSITAAQAMHTDFRNGSSIQYVKVAFPMIKKRQPRSWERGCRGMQHYLAAGPPIHQKLSFSAN
jgi:hypothetical protein